MGKDVLIDFETMGKDATTCAVIDCSVIVFDKSRFLSNKPYDLSSISEAKKFKLSIKDQVVNYGYIVDKSTVKFWEEQSPEVRAKIMPKKDDLTVAEFCSELLSFLSGKGKIDYWWSRSNTFDPIILARLFQSQNKLLMIEEYLKFWRVRDMRTFIDAKLDFPKVNGFVPIKDEKKWEANFKQHDSAWDVLADLLRMQTIARIENDMEQT